jgi:hypothetical protein
MPGISNRIVSFANFYNQLKILVIVVRPFVKQAPDLDYGLYHLPELELWLTAVVTGQQRMLTLPRNLIPSLIYPEVRVCPILNFIFLLD